MTTQEILNLDYESNKKTIQKVLRKIPPLAKYEMDEEVPFDMLEKLVGKYVRKYAVMLSNIYPTYIEGERDIYCGLLNNTVNNNLICYIHASSLYELYAKTSIKIYSLVKSKNIKLQDWEKFKEDRNNKYKEIMRKGNK